MRSLLLLFTFFAGGAQAQIWCPPGAHWLFDTGSPWSTSQTLLTYVGDTVIDGYTAQRIDRHFLMTELFGNDTLIESNGTGGFTRYDEDIVYERTGNAWDTLYWFGALPGDEWQPFSYAGFECPDHVLHVLDTGSVVVDGIPLRSVTGEVYELGMPIGIPFTATERLGGLGGQFFPGYTPCAVVECYCSFLCYADQEMSYPFSGGSCELTLGTTEMDQPPALLVHPNPGIDLVTLQWRGGGFSAVFMDATGRFVQAVQSSTDRVSVQMGHLAPGAYMVRCSDGSSMHTAKWIKH